VATGGCAGQRGDGAPVEPRELIGLGVLAAVLLQAERTHVGDRLAARRVGHTAAGMADHRAEHARSRAGERPRHCGPLAEPLELDARQVDAQISLDLFEDVIDEGRIRSSGPQPARGVRGDEDGAPLRQIEEAEVSRIPRDVAPFSGGAVEADDEPVRMRVVVVRRPAEEVLPCCPAAGDRVVGERCPRRAVLQRRRLAAARGHHRATARASGAGSAAAPRRPRPATARFTRGAAAAGELTTASARTAE